MGVEIEKEGLLREIPGAGFLQLSLGLFSDLQGTYITWVATNTYRSWGDLQGQASCALDTVGPDLGRSHSFDHQVAPLVLFCRQPKLGVAWAGGQGVSSLPPCEVQLAGVLSQTGRLGSKTSPTPFLLHFRGPQLGSSCESRGDRPAHPPPPPRGVLPKWPFIQSLQGLLSPSVPAPRSRL